MRIDVDDDRIDRLLERVDLRLQQCEGKEVAAAAGEAQADERGVAAKGDHAHDRHAVGNPVAIGLFESGAGEYDGAPVAIERDDHVVHHVEPWRAILVSQWYPVAYLLEGGRRMGIIRIQEHATGLPG